MARKHAFFIVVLLAAAALAGFTAFARTVNLSQPATATATPSLPDAGLEKRLRALDRFEAKLRRQLAARPPARKAAPTAVVTRVAAPAPAPAYEDEDDEHEEDDD